jgi:hypothetical protein
MKKQFLRLIAGVSVMASLASATDYSNPYYYINYTADQYALVMSDVNYVGTHTAGNSAEMSDRGNIASQFASFPTVNDSGEVCFSALADDASGENGATELAALGCKTPDAYYVLQEGTTFFLYMPSVSFLAVGTAGETASFSENKFSSYSEVSFANKTLTVVAPSTTPSSTSEVPLPSELAGDSTFPGQPF